MWTNYFHFITFIKLLFFNSCWGKFVVYLNLDRISHYTLFYIQYSNIQATCDKKNYCLLSCGHTKLWAYKICRLEFTKLELGNAEKSESSLPEHAYIWMKVNGMKSVHPYWTWGLLRRWLVQKKNIYILCYSAIHQFWQSTDTYKFTHQWRYYGKHCYCN